MQVQPKGSDGNVMVGILIDRFGKDIPIKQVDENFFRTTVNVAISSQFLGWIMALGNGIRIVGPISVVERMQQEIKSLSKIYES